ncbi:MAG TPA: response regulator transcription factor [Chitinophagales bacterium]|nr:response regulator transcription factor [Chitinophagales bacterium]MCB9074699.1 response regulator transcription factor [Chitinophagales bacterium]HMU98463.1 response regulator transcription factor [Chitinophagales bacterium]HMV03796.1 response regulator transcription factor [Chitinophagales bacterium]HMW94915.1 response regulator transcription factor [Chitinophagales bacterium]
MVYKYLVIEDNPREIELLDILMQEYPEFQKTIVTCDFKEGIKEILKQKPDLVFLDVELPDFTGFELLKELQNHLQELPEIIMATAHEKYAIDAVNKDILYYLLKPIDPDELIIAINRFYIKKAKTNKSITIKTNKGFSFLNFDDIFLIKSASNYTCFYTRTLQQIVVSKTMKEYELFLNEDFLRIHKSYTINTKYIRFLNVGKKRVQLSIPELKNLDAKDNFFDHFLDSLCEENNIELPIGDVYMEKVKNSVLYSKIN